MKLEGNDETRETKRIKRDNCVASRPQLAQAELFEPLKRSIIPMTNKTNRKRKIKKTNEKRKVAQLHACIHTIGNQKVDNKHR